MFYDEAYERPGTPRAHYSGLLSALDGRDLGDLGREVAQAAQERGIAFGEEPDSAFLVDPIPRLITAEEWRDLEAGLVQRVRALDAFVADAYGERRIVEAGVVPAHVIDSAEYHEPALAGHDLPGGVSVAGLDIVRDRDGRFLVLEDNVRTPSGIAYVVAARELSDRRIADSVPEPHDVDGAFALLGATLRAAAPGGRPDPLVAVLTDGPANTAWWEHRTIAERLGLALVGVADLEVADDGLYASIDGRSRRLDVVYRRTSEDRLRGEDGRPTDVARVLEEPWLRGQVGLVNAFGAGVADDKLAHAYVPDMIRFYLGQEPLLPSVRTYDLAVPAALEDVLSRIDELVVKPRDGSGGNGVVIGPHADEADTAATAEAVRRRPEGYVAQEVVPFSRHPTLVDGRLEPRHVDLRAFVFLAGEHATALPGGLTRVALEEGALVVNSSQNGGAKDTWVLR
ncbi:MAG TPA: circularly permuted type 2 ATP-grasp protein [Solirubrobacteraceae bacterium]